MREYQNTIEFLLRSLYEHTDENVILDIKNFPRKSGKTIALSKLAKEKNVLYVCSNVNLCKVAQEKVEGIDCKSTQQLLSQHGAYYDEFIIDEIRFDEIDKLAQVHPYTKMFGIAKR